jgi:hypothetical protein
MRLASGGTQAQQRDVIRKIIDILIVCSRRRMIKSWQVDSSMRPSRTPLSSFIAIEMIQSDFGPSLLEQGLQISHPILERLQIVSWAMEASRRILYKAVFISSDAILTFRRLSIAFELLLLAMGACEHRPLAKANPLRGWAIRTIRAHGCAFSR